MCGAQPGDPSHAGQSSGGPGSGSSGGGGTGGTGGGTAGAPALAIGEAREPKSADASWHNPIFQIEGPSNSSDQVEQQLSFSGVTIESADEIDPEQNPPSDQAEVGGSNQ